MKNNQSSSKINSQISWEEIVFYLKKYGFIVQSSKIYQDLRSSFDFGPYGTFIQEEIIKKWSDFFITSQPNIYPIKTSIFTSEKVLKSSQHLEKFIDYVFECEHCKTKNKIDLSWEKLQQKPTIICQKCQKKIENDLTTYELLFSLFIGKKKQKQKIFLRPETAQGIFINFRHFMRLLRIKLPFGFGQIGKAFRHEFTTKYGLFRTFEFQQMELEFFYQNLEKRDFYFHFFQNKIIYFLENILKIRKKNYRLYEQTKDELAHYSKKTIDFEFKFPFGWKEIWGLADRSNFDISKHHQNCNEDLYVQNENKKFFPYVIEPSCGVERLFLALIINHLHQDQETKRYTLNLPASFSYYQVAILPLTSKLKETGEKIYQLFLKNKYRVVFDVQKSIGKRYLYHDAIGTYLCITIDFETKNDQKVTLRNRQTKKQQRVLISSLFEMCEYELKNC